MKCAETICKLRFSGLGIKFDIDMIRSDKRYAEHVFMRRVVCDILKKEGFSLNEIGAFINRNHSAVKHMLNHIPNWDKASVVRNQIDFHVKEIERLRIVLLMT